MSVNSLLYMHALKVFWQKRKKARNALDQGNPSPLPLKQLGQNNYVVIIYNLKKCIKMSNDNVLGEAQLRIKKKGSIKTRFD